MATQAKERGVDVVVVDHHEPKLALPDCVAVVNPKLETDSEFEYLCSVGIVFKVWEIDQDTLTPDLEAELRRLGFTGPVWAIPNFRDPEPFVAVDRAVAGRKLRAELRLDDNVDLVGLVGHLIEQKRPDRALDALEAMHARGAAAHLVVAGDGPLRGDLERDVARRGLAAYVHLLGSRDDIAYLLAAIDVLILTSDAEGLPGVLIEAQMAGCPIVTVPVGGVRELVDDGETGLVTEQVDATELAERVVGLLRDPKLRARLGERARRRAVRFTSRAAAGTYAARLAEIAGV